MTRLELDDGFVYYFNYTVCAGYPPQGKWADSDWDAEGCKPYAEIDWVEVKGLFETTCGGEDVMVEVPISQALQNERIDVQCGLIERMILDGEVLK